MRACDYSVFEFRYRTKFPERVATCGGMDSELTGRYITEERVYRCVAPTTELAKAAYNRYHSKDTLIDLVPLYSLQDIIIIG